MYQLSLQNVSRQELVDSTVFMMICAIFMWWLLLTRLTRHAKSVLMQKSDLTLAWWNTWLPRRCEACRSTWLVDWQGRKRKYLDTNRSAREPMSLQKTHVKIRWKGVIIFQGGIIWEERKVTGWSEPADLEPVDGQPMGRLIKGRNGKWEKRCGGGGSMSWLTPGASIRKESNSCMSLLIIVV
jgi:hypothetical protein